MKWKRICRSAVSLQRPVRPAIRLYRYAFLGRSAWRLQYGTFFSGAPQCTGVGLPVYDMTTAGSTAVDLATTVFIIAGTTVMP